MTSQHDLRGMARGARRRFVRRARALHPHDRVSVLKPEFDAYVRALRKLHAVTGTAAAMPTDIATFFVSVRFGGPHA